MANISKQDVVGARTAADIERKYNFGKSFSEVMGFAEKAQRSAEEAKAAVDILNDGLSPEEIFNRLTNNGEAEGLFRDDDGQLYINAEYIVAIAKLFAKDIEMTGKFTCNTEGYLVPGDEEIATVQNHVLGNITIPNGLLPIYDFNADGKITSPDALRAHRMKMGIASMADWPNAKKTPVKIEIDMSNPEKAIRMSGTNMWGREVSGYIGINGTNIPLAGLADYVVEEGTSGVWTYRKWNSGKAECWGVQEIEGSFSGTWGALYILAPNAGKVSYPITFVEAPIETVTVRATERACFAFAESGGDGLNTTTSTAAYNAARTSQYTDTETVRFSYSVVGRWK